jgi:hypothetical protein
MLEFNGAIRLSGLLFSKKKSVYRGSATGPYELRGCTVSRAAPVHTNFDMTTMRVTC